MLSNLKMRHTFKLFLVAVACLYCFLLLEIVRTLYSYGLKAVYDKRSDPSISLENYVSRDTNFTAAFSGIINLSENRRTNARVNGGVKNLTALNSDKANVPVSVKDGEKNLTASNTSKANVLVTSGLK